MLLTDGRLSPKLCVVLAEPSGTFLQSFRNTASNLVVKCHRSHIMTKQLMKEWLVECVLTEDFTRLVLIVDSWSSFRDHETIQSLVPRGRELIVRNNPPGATSLIQPLDVFIFRVLRTFLRRIHGYIMAASIEFQISQRDNTLRILEVVWNQFCNPRFKSFLLYSWAKAGYVDRDIVEFETPVQACFPNMLCDCQFTGGCSNASFIRCSYCNLLFCFNHFVTIKHIEQL